MRSKDLKSLFEKLNVMSSHGRPHTSNDNAFAESIFATMKGRVIYPEYFNCIEDAEAFVAEFVEWYNYEHLHSSLDLLTPYSVHYGMQERYLSVGTTCSRKPVNYIRNDSGPSGRFTELNRKYA